MTLKIREPGSAITHFIAMLLALFSAAPLLVRSALRSDATSLAAMSVFICSMILLYGQARYIIRSMFPEGFYAPLKNSTT